MKDYIAKRVHELYWEQDLNCARTTMICLSELFQVTIDQSVFWAAAGMHGAGKYRAQCGLVEGALMFTGVYFQSIGKTEEEAVSACYHFAELFEKEYGSLRCRELRPTGFSEDDPPHMCEQLTCSTIEFAYQYIKQAVREREKS